MTQTLKIKRSTTTASPTSLENGELAYSSNSNKLFIGRPGGTTGDIDAIGGKFFTDMLDHTAGTLTASSAVIVDANSKIDVFNVDNIRFDGNSITSTDTGGNIVISPDTTGSIVLDGQNWPQADGTSGQYLTTNGSGQISWTTFNIVDDTTPQLGGNLDVNGNSIVSASNGNIAITPDGTGSVVLDGQNWPQADGTSGQYLTTNGSGQLSWAAAATGDIVDDTTPQLGGNLDVNGNSIISASNGNIAITPNGTGSIVLDGQNWPQADGSADSFLKTNGSGQLSWAAVPSGAFTISDGSTTDTFTTGQTLTFTGSSGITTTVSDNQVTFALGTLTSLDVDNLTLDGNEISSTNANGNISLNPNGTGSVNVNSAKITNLGAPSASTDAATKQYVDAVAQGLHVHAQVHAITTTSLATITGGSVTYDNGTSGVGATLTLGTALDLAGGDIDGDTDITTGDRIIINGESNAAHNGIYVITSTTVLTRADDFDSSVEMAGGDFVFVTHGTTYADTGWVLGEAVSTVGTDDVDFIQFSGAGTYTAGSGLTLTGTAFSVNVAASGGIEISTGDLQLKSTIAGDGLTYSSGVVAVGGTSNRIDVSADAIDISTSYVGQATITTLGTIATGTWNADTITEAYGGTNQTTYTRGDILYASAANTLSKLSLGTSGQVLVSDGTDISWASIDGGTF